jgi:hypothetical protein
VKAERRDAHHRPEEAVAAAGRLVRRMRSASLLISTRRLRPEPPVKVVASVCVVSVIVAVFVVLAVVVLKYVLVHGNELPIAGRRVLDRRFLVVGKDDTFDGVFSDLFVVVGRV